MNHDYRPRPQLGEVLPGALTLGLFFIWFYRSAPTEFGWLSSSGSALLVVVAAGFLFSSWIAGTLIDSIRNAFIESLIDECSAERLRWDFFFDGTPEKVAQLDQYYFAYYQAKANYAIGLAIFSVSFLLMWFCWHPDRYVEWSWAVAVAFLIICIFDAWSLRQEVKRLVRRE